MLIQISVFGVDEANNPHIITPSPAFIKIQDSVGNDLFTNICSCSGNLLVLTRLRKSNVRNNIVVVALKFSLFPLQPVIAETVYLLLTKEHRISKHLRAKWYMKHVNTTMEFPYHEVRHFCNFLHLWRVERLNIFDQPVGSRM